MRPCQGRDRGFEPRRSRQSKETYRLDGSFIMETVGTQGVLDEPQPLHDAARSLPPEQIDGSFLLRDHRLSFRN